MKRCDDMDIDGLKDILHEEGCSCVIYAQGQITLCHERGVKDLLRILKSEPGLLAGSVIADKVVGKGAAALMVLGGVNAVYADVISQPAFDLLASASIEVSYGECVDNIINRAGTGVCPVETLCKDCATAIECLPLIEQFVNKNNDKR